MVRSLSIHSSNAISLRWSCLIIACLALVASPFFKEDFDVLGCWLKWSIASDGNRPWAIYAANTDCNYPAFVPYLLTLSQACINATQAVQTGPLAILIVKLPNLIACLLGTWICLVGLRPLTGQRTAIAAATLYVFCAPLWFNAAIWGQWDSLSSLAMVAGILAVANHRPTWAGIAIGWAFSIKLHAIVLLPAVLVYTFRRWSWIQIVRMVGCGLIVWELISLPFFIAGQGKALIRSYTGAINFYPGLTEGAFNGWQLLHFYNLTVRHQSPAIAGFDGQLLFAYITAREIGLSLFAAYTLWLMAILFRRPTHINFIATAGLTAVAFFMLPTQVHQRYLVPAAAIFVLVAHAGYRKSYFVIMLAALINQWVVLEYERRGLSIGATQANRELFMQLYCTFSGINLIGFAWITWHHYRQVFQSATSI